MKLVRLLAPAVAVVALAGCSNSPATAAVVDGETIRMDKVNQLVADCPDFNGEPTTASVAVTALVRNVLVQRAAAAVDATIDDAGIDTLIGGSDFATEIQAKPGCRSVLWNQAALSQLGDVVGQDEDKIMAAQEQLRLPVELNPRFGTWDPASTMAAGGGSLSKDSAAAATDN